MLNNKKGRMMRHPYASLAIFSLATAGVVSITKKTKKFFKEKMKCVSDAVKEIKE